MTHGQFVFHDLYSSDAPAARAFYSDLLGWTYQEFPMGEDQVYFMAWSNGRAVGGINGLLPGMNQSAWISYISVDNLTATLAAITDSGGAIDVPPFNIPGIGSMAYARDPHGAVFAPFNGPNPVGVSEEPSIAPVPGSPVWMELSTPDPAASIAFYKSVAGWNHVAWPLGDYEYNGMLLGEVPVAGIWQAPEGAPPAWTLYIEAAKGLDAAISAIPDLGGTLIGDRIHVEGTGDFQIAQDPSGAMFGLLQSEPM